MKTDFAVVSELWGLFVEDLSYSAAIAGWVGVLAFLNGGRIIPRGACGPVLVLGLVVILVENVLRTSKRGR
jgi:hypothetical protein